MVDIANYREMSYQYETLKEELKRYSSELATRPFAIAITKIDALPIEEVNEKMEEFIKSLGLEPNNNIEKFGMNFEVTSYMFKKDFGVELPDNEPQFILPISSIAQFNSKTIKFALGEFIEDMK